MSYQAWFEQAEAVHRRHQDRVGDPLALDHRQRLAGPEPVHHHGAAADGDHGQELRDEPGDVRDGRRHQRPVVL